MGDIGTLCRITESRRQTRGNADRRPTRLAWVWNNQRLWLTLESTGFQPVGQP